MSKLIKILIAFSIILGISILTGFIPNEHLIKESLKKGNEYFVKEDYDLAIKSYTKGLDEQEDERLLNNIGLADMKKTDYENAIKHLKESDGNFILRGNANYYLAKSQTDSAEKLDFYRLALYEYKEGIKNDPKDLKLKYNYEFVSRILEQTEEQISQEQQSEGGKSDGEKSQEQESQGQKSEGEKSAGEKSDGEKTKEDGEEKSAGGKSDEESDEESDEKSFSEEDGDSEEVQTQEEGDVAQILYLLEQKESESLKNNQEIRNEGGADSNDW